MVEMLTLTGNDLAELGVRLEDTGRVLSLITKLKLMSSPAHTPGQCKWSLVYITLYALCNAVMFIYASVT